MKRKPSTNPQINGKPMSFVRLGSSAARFYFSGELKGRFTDARGVSYEAINGTVYRRSIKHSKG
jgi:hypothetical protein